MFGAREVAILAERGSCCDNERHVTSGYRRIVQASSFAQALLLIPQRSRNQASIVQKSRNTYCSSFNPLCWSCVGLSRFVVLVVLVLACVAFHGLLAVASHVTQ